MKKSINFGALIIIGLFTLPFLAVLVSAAETNVLTIISDFVSKNLANEDTVVSFSKLLLTILLALVVYSAADSIPFVESASSGIKWTFSIIVAILGFILVSSDSIRYILVNYEAMGIALTTIIPLVIIIAFAWRMQHKNPLIAFFANKILIPVFILYSLYSWFSLYMVQNRTDSPLFWIYLLTIIIALLWWAFGRKLQDAISKQEQLDENKTVKTEAEDAAAMMKSLVEMKKELAAHGKAISATQKQIENAAKKEAKKRS